VLVSKEGDIMECSIWSGPQKGVRIGEVNRRLHFSQNYESIVIEIEGKSCTVDFSTFPNFWTACSEIRVAKNEVGRNKLREFIEKIHLLAPMESLRKKGRGESLWN
jgi:hypothetical protein